MKRKAFRKVVPLLVFSGIAANPTHAADGDLVPVFGTGGVLDLSTFFATESLGFEGPAVQPDGRMVVAGTIGVGDEYEIRVLRIDSSGALDSQFGVQGIVNLDIGSGLEKPREVFVLPDKAILVVGVTDASSSASNSFIARLLPDGTPDPNFGSGGVVIENLAPGFADIIFRSAVQHDGKLLIGTDGNSVYRLLPDGSRDSSFGVDGRSSTRNGFSATSALAQGDDGFIYVGGGHSFLNDDQNFLLTRVFPTGGADANFADQAVAEVEASATNDFVTDLAITSDGFITIVGLTDGGTLPDGSSQRGSAVARVAPDGTPDSTFGDNAVTKLMVPGRRVLARSIELAPDGRILVAGNTLASDGTHLEIFVARLLADGQLDMSFGSGGYVEIDTAVDTGLIFIDTDQPGLVLHPEGRLLVLDWKTPTMAMFEYELGELTPELPSFAPVTGVVPGEMQSSEMVIIQGADTGLTMPLQVKGGEYALDGGDAFASLPAQVRTGQRARLRHIAAPTLGTDTTTTLTLGGYRRSNNAALVLGQTVTASFVSTTTRAPMFIDAPTSASVEENSPLGVLIATVRADDADGDALAYSIIGGNSAGAFSINSAAELRVTGALDFESQDTYSLELHADDSKGGTATHNIVVAVSDVPEPPVITAGGGTFPVPEDSAIGHVITTIVAIDPEGSTLTYRIDSGNEASGFEVAENGVLALAGSLDFKQAASHTLTVIAEDASGASASVTVTIDVIAVDSGGDPFGGESSRQSGGGSAGVFALLALMLALLLRWINGCRVPAVSMTRLLSACVM